MATESLFPRANGPAGVRERRERHPRAAEPATLLFALVLAVAGAVVGMEVVVSLGVTPNTSIVGVVVAILVSRIPLGVCSRFRSIHRQNLIQTTISSATFGAANSLLVPVGVPVLLGRPELVMPMLVGATAGMLIDLAMLYWLFDSRLFPGSGPWPIGIASAEAILAGDEGGRRARLLGLGAAAGIVGSSGLFGALRTVGAGTLPMAAFGIAFLGNPWALGMFGAGLLVRGYSGPLAGLDPEKLLVPHGMMIGAGVAAFGQAVAMALRRREARAFGLAPLSRSEHDARAGLARGLALYLAAAVILAALGGLWTEMSGPRLAAWIAFAAVACVAAELIVGLSAMQAGWFPAFATALVFLLVGLALGFPAGAAALLVGFVAAGGPAFADAGYDLKTGWVLRGLGRDLTLEMDGRWQQVLAALLGLLTALAMVALFHTAYFRGGAFPPVARVYAAAIGSGVEPGAAVQLLLWAAPGALLQLLGGSRRQLGILLATGLLIRNPLAGWAVFLALAIRGILAQRMGSHASPLTTVLAGGIIAGDALWGFVGSLVR